MDVLHELVRTVTRMFHDEKCIILMEFILHERMYPFTLIRNISFINFFSLSDEELADRMRVVLKDVNRTAARLREEKLLAQESRQEVRPSDQKLVNKTYYYIDFKSFVDVVKYKMYMMKRSLEDTLRNVI